MARIVGPLGRNVPIVDSQGRPTPEFMAKWNAQSRVNGAIPELSTPEQVSAVLDVLAGLPGDLLVRGANYWAGMHSPGDAGKFLSGTNPPQWGSVHDDDLSLSDILTNDVSILRHGFAPKLPGDSAKFLDGSGSWSVPAGGGMTLPSIIQVESSGGSGAPSITFSSAPADGSLLVAFLNRTSTSAPTPDAGWDRVVTSTTNMGFYIFTKRCGASESATQSPTSSSNNHSVCIYELADAGGLYIPFSVVDDNDTVLTMDLDFDAHRAGLALGGAGHLNTNINGISGDVTAFDKLENGYSPRGAWWHHDVADGGSYSSTLALATTARTKGFVTLVI